MKLWFWKAKQMSPEEREISESIKLLKTLKVYQGRVSIDPSEVLDQPGYQEARQRAADIIRRRNTRFTKPCVKLGWCVIDRVGMGAVSTIIAESLMRSRLSGLSFIEALEQLKSVAFQENSPHD